MARKVGWCCFSGACVYSRLPIFKRLFRCGCSSLVLSANEIINLNIWKKTDISCLVAWTIRDMRDGDHQAGSPNSKLSCKSNRKSTLSSSGGGLIDVSKSPSEPVLEVRLFSRTPSFLRTSIKPIASKPAPVQHGNKHGKVSRNEISKEERREGKECQMFGILEQCDWYYENLSSDESQNMLKNTEIGTFLLRKSSSPQHQFSLSVQTSRGPTSVRLQNTNGMFQLQSQSHLRPIMPAFRSVVDLIEFYVMEYKQSIKDSNMPVWVDNDGKLHSAIVIGKPLKKEPSSLKHLTRLAIERTILPHPKPENLSPLFNKLQLPSSLISYLEKYPHTI